MSTACLLWCHSGATTVTLKDRNITLVAGDLLLAPEGAEWNAAGGLVLDITFPTLETTGPARRLHLGQAWGERMIHEYARSLFGEPALSPEVAKLFSDRVTPPPMPTARNARAVADILQSNPADQTSLEEFAERQRVASRTLQRQFLSGTGYSFSEWRAAHRVCVAASLLAHDFSISVASNLVGFAATSSLTRAFRRHTGATPSAFTTGTIGMGVAGDPPVIPASSSIALTDSDQQVWIYSGTATVTTPGFCRFLGAGEMATIPAGTQTRIDVASGSIAIPVPVGVNEEGMDLRTAVELRDRLHSGPTLTPLNDLDVNMLEEDLRLIPVQSGTQN